MIFLIEESLLIVIISTSQDLVGVTRETDWLTQDLVGVIRETGWLTQNVDIGRWASVLAVFFNFGLTQSQPHPCKRHITLSFREYFLL